MGNPMETRGGKRAGAGRPPGSTSRFNGAFREAVQIVYNEMGGHKAFTQWAKKNPTEYYRIAARLIPVEFKETSDKTVTVIVHREGGPMPPAVVNPTVSVRCDVLPDYSTNGNGSNG